ncbi:ABC transporter permease [Haloparvum sedimenti]|uniref:ABC transporter permease n=1 Tax=Haloparvum sedimenti TaxID=1678448 RepID=UPI0009B5ABD4|nr:ABC transporter permease [Haloparvum sedimenti]
MSIRTQLSRYNVQLLNGDVKSLLSDSFARMIGIGVGFVLWSLLAAQFPRELLPTPIETVGLAWGLVADGTAWIHISTTFQSLFWAFLFAMLLGGTLGVLMGLNSYSQNFFTPYVNIGLSIPGLAWAAVAFLVFSYGSIALGTLRFAPVVAATLTVFPYVAINIWKGVENIDHDLLRMANAFSISRRRVLWRVVLPNIAPQIFSAVRFGLAIGWKVTIIAELFAGSAGVGYKLEHAYQVYQYEEAWAWAAVFLFIIILIEYGVFKPIERRAFDWRSDVELSDIGGA